MTFLSLGGGVQSSVMLMMAIQGEIERPDHVLFADTGWDGERTMDHVAWCEAQCVKAGIPFHRVTSGNIRQDMLVARTADSGDYRGVSVSMPVFVDTGGQVEGRIRRQCTSEYKLAPLRTKQRELLGYQPRQRIPAAACEVWIGISTDEARRAAPSRDRWVDNVFPLIDPLKMNRADCQAWWEAHYPHRRLGKSACLGCPNRSDREWAALKRESPDEWAQVVEFDQRIRVATGMRGQSYLHRSLRPLDQVPLNEGQANMDLEDAVYCAGGVRTVKAFRLKTLHPTEHQVQAAILRYLAVSPRVAWAQRMNTGAIKIPVPGGRDRFLRFGFPGCPDILGQLTDGRLLAIEVKSPSGRASEAQGAFLALVATNGGVAILARSTDDLTAILEMPA